MQWSAKSRPSFITWASTAALPAQNAFKRENRFALSRARCIWASPSCPGRQERSASCASVLRVSDLAASSQSVSLFVEPIRYSMSATARVSSLSLFGVLSLGMMASEYVQLRSEEHTSELQSRGHLVCRLLLE